MQRAHWLFLLNAGFSVALVAPAYLYIFNAGVDYSVSLSCDPVRPESIVLPLEGNDDHAWLGILTSCAVTNLDRQAATVEAVSATATTTSNGPVFRFTPDLSSGAFASVPELAERRLPVELEPNATWNFAGLFVLPLPDNWDDGSPSCERLQSHTSTALWRASGCLTMLATDQLDAYIAGLRFPGTHGTGYRNFSVEVRFDNGDAVSSPMELNFPATG